MSVLLGLFFLGPELGKQDVGPRFLEPPPLLLLIQLPGPLPSLALQLQRLQSPPSIFRLCLSLFAPPAQVLRGCAIGGLPSTDV